VRSKQLAQEQSRPSQDANGQLLQSQKEAETSITIASLRDNLQRAFGDIEELRSQLQQAQQAAADASAATEASLAQLQAAQERANQVERLLADAQERETQMRQVISQFQLQAEQTGSQLAEVQAKLRVYEGGGVMRLQQQLQEATAQTTEAEEQRDQALQVVAELNQRLRQEVTNHERQNRLLETTAQSPPQLYDALAAAERRIQQVSEELTQEHARELAALQHQLQQAQEQMHKTEQERDQALEAVVALNGRLRSEVTHHQAEQAEQSVVAQQRLHEVEARLAKVEAERDQALQFVASLRAEQEQRQAAVVLVGELEKKLQHAQGELGAAVSQRDQAINTMSDLSLRLQAAERRAEALEQQAAQSTSPDSELQRALAGAEALNGELRESVQALEARVAQLQLQTRQSGERAAAAESKAYAAHQQATALQQELQLAETVRRESVASSPHQHQQQQQPATLPPPPPYSPTSARAEVEMLRADVADFEKEQVGRGGKENWFVATLPS
jgi:chromosome segregation ATPase